MPTGRKIAWFFGAGASRAAGAYTSAQRSGKIKIPTQADFWSTVLKYAKSSDKSTIESFLFRYFKMYSRIPARLSHSERGRQLNDVNVEEVFTFLTERMSTESISASLRAYFANEVWPSLLSAVSRTFGKFTDNEDTRSVYRSFSRNLLKTRDAIISFNYDIVLEKSLPASKHWYYVPSTNTGIPVFKPHGSINWQQRKDGSIRFRKTPSDHPVIIAPTHLKFVALTDHQSTNNIGLFNQSKEIPAIWQKMEEEMAQAKALVFIGYSFPDADLYFSSVLRSVFQSVDRQHLIILVNPDAMRLSEKLRQRFAVAPKQIQNYFDFRSFCRITRTELLSA